MVAMEAESIRVEIIDCHLIKPERPSPQASVLLTPCDVMLRDYSYNRRVLFYERPVTAGGDDDYPCFLGTLRRSLSQALAAFYPLAGRLDAAADDDSLRVLCNDEGAELVQARIHGASFAHLRASNFDMQAYFVHLTRWALYSRLQHEGSAPLLSLQVTRFPCGSIALGIAHSHVVADGFSLWHFMSSWAECARGEPLSLWPSHDHTPFMVQNVPLENADIQLFEDDSSNNQEEGGDKAKEGDVIRQHAFSFSKEMVEELKGRAGNEFSSYEVVCAHIWKAVSRARAHGKDVRVSFGSVVNMRGRMEPPLPPGYLGNALLWGMAVATMAELQSEDLGTTAARIRTSVRHCTPSRMHQLIADLHLHGRSAVFAKSVVNGVRMRVSSSFKFPVMSTHFGWGRPLAVRSVVVEENDGKLVFYPGSIGMGSVDACLSLPSQVMESLKSDPSFLAHKLTPNNF